MLQNSISSWKVSVEKFNSKWSQNIIDIHICGNVSVKNYQRCSLKLDNSCHKVERTLTPSVKFNRTSVSIPLVTTSPNALPAIRTAQLNAGFVRKKHISTLPSCKANMHAFPSKSISSMPWSESMCLVRPSCLQPGISKTTLDYVGMYNATKKKRAS